MKRETLHLQHGISIETGRDFNGRFFIAYAKGASVFVRDHKELRQFLRLPAKTPSRESLDSWLASLSHWDDQKEGPATPPKEELLATGFGPECHLDESDPNYQTKTVI